MSKLEEILAQHNRVVDARVNSDLSFFEEQDTLIDMITELEEASKPKEVSRDNLTHGMWYWLVSIEGEATLVYYYHNISSGDDTFGFNRYDGGAYLPLKDLRKSSKIFTAPLVKPEGE